MSLTQSTTGETTIDCPFDYLTEEPKNVTLNLNENYMKVKKYFFNKDEAYEAYNALLELKR